MDIKFKKFSDRAVKPFLAMSGSACYDLCSTSDYLIYPNSVRKIGLEIPGGFCGKIYTRSSWAKKYTCVEGGVIDSDYRGKIKLKIKFFITIQLIGFMMMMSTFIL